MPLVSFYTPHPPPPPLNLWLSDAFRVHSKGSATWNGLKLGIYLKRDPWAAEGTDTFFHLHQGAYASSVVVDSKSLKPRAY